MDGGVFGALGTKTDVSAELALEGCVLLAVVPDMPEPARQFDSSLIFSRSTGSVELVVGGISPPFKQTKYHT